MSSGTGRSCTGQHGRELALTDWQSGIGTWDAFDPWAGLPDTVQADREQVHAELHGRILADIQEQDVRPGVRAVLEAAAACRISPCPGNQQ